MQTTKSNTIKKFFLAIIAIGVVIICLQNFGFLPTDCRVTVKGGVINVSGDVDVTGTVSVDNTVDVNLEQILGNNVGCRQSYTIDGKKYVSLDVTTR